MNNFISFDNKESFLNWLDQNHPTCPGFFLRFDKTKTTSSLTYEEALDIALCYGFIDGVTKKIDENFYTRYFTKRSQRSIWSTKNKISALRLIKQNLMKPSGMEAILLAKSDGRWDKADLPPKDYSISDFNELLNPYFLAQKNFQAFSNSIKKTYAMSYYTLKKQESRDRRLKVIIERLENNLKPM